MTSDIISSEIIEEEPKTNNIIITELLDNNVVNTETIDNVINTCDVEDKSNTSNTVVTEIKNIPDKQTNFKSWMPYTMLNKKSLNYKTIKKDGYIDENGLCRIKEYYCVALGSYYSTELGDLFKVTLDNGNEFIFITMDHKADIHTDSNNQITIKSGCMTEFIVDKNKLNKQIKVSGTVSSLDCFNGLYVKIEKIGNYFTESEE